MIDWLIDLIKRKKLFFFLFFFNKGSPYPTKSTSEDHRHWYQRPSTTMADFVRNISNATSLGTEPLQPSLHYTAASFVSASLICLLIICALTANTFVCLAVYKQRSARRITRYFIINLCVADIFITVISMPVWLIFLLYDNRSAVYLLGESFVTIWRHVDILCGTASILSLTSISVDRYIAVSRPYSYVECITSRRALFMIGGIWSYSITVAVLFKPLREFKGGKWNMRPYFTRSNFGYYLMEMDRR